MDLRDLVEAPGLGLTLLYGEQALSRPIRSVFTTDLIDPGRYLTEGALVLTGLMWRRDPDDSDRFVRVLAHARVAALAAGEAAFGSIPADVVQACRRHRVPLVAVPVDVSFAQVSELVTTRDDAERERALATALGRERRLLAAITEGRSLDELLTMIGHDTGVTCRVLTPTGRSVAAPAGPLDTADTDAVCRTFQLAERLPSAVSLPTGRTVSVVDVEPRLGQSMTPWFLVCDGDHRTWDDDAHVSLRDLGAVIAAQRRRWDEDRRSTRRSADDVIALTVTGQASRAELAARMGDLGADPGRPCLVAAAIGADEFLDTTCAVLHDAASQIADHPISGVRDGTVITILTRVAAGGSDTLRRAVERLAVGSGRLSVGVSGEVSVDALAGAIDEAMHAVHTAELRDQKVAVVTSDEIRSHVLLLGAVPDRVRHAFAVRVLGGVLDYDVRHASALLPTLDAFLRADGSWSRCAADLHVHVNTARYRIGRVEQLTGRDLSRLEDRVDLLLALRSLPAR